MYTFSELPSSLPILQRLGPYATQAEATAAACPNRMVVSGYANDQGKFYKVCARPVPQLLTMPSVTDKEPTSPADCARGHFYIAASTGGSRTAPIPVAARCVECRANSFTLSCPGVPGTGQRTPQTIPVPASGVCPDPYRFYADADCRQADGNIKYKTTGRCERSWTPLDPMSAAEAPRIIPSCAGTGTPGTFRIISPGSPPPATCVDCQPRQPPIPSSKADCPPGSTFYPGSPGGTSLPGSGISPSPGWPASCRLPSGQPDCPTGYVFQLIAGRPECYLPAATKTDAGTVSDSWLTANWKWLAAATAAVGGLVYLKKRAK